MHSKDEIQADRKNRIDRAFYYIEENLDTHLSLSKVADVACFSPFHFHRIFKTVTGETLNEFITRKKIERSVADLLHKDLKVGEIAHSYGFGDNAAFTKAFKKYYGYSPSAFKKRHPNPLAKIRRLQSKNGQKYPDPAEYLCIINQLRKWMNMNAKINIKELPEMNFAYISCLGAQELPGAFQKLIQWAAPKGLMSDQARLMTIYHDSLKITEEEKARFSACFILKQLPNVKSDIALNRMPGGRFIVGSFEISTEEFEKSWSGLYLWMNENGYQRADRDSFEIYYNNFNEHPEKKAIVDFCITIQ